MSATAAKRTPQVVLFGIGNHVPNLLNTRHNVGAIVLQKYFDHLVEGGFEYSQTGKNAYKFKNLTVENSLLEEHRQKMIARLTRKWQVENGLISGRPSESKDRADKGSNALHRVQGVSHVLQGSNGSESTEGGKEILKMPEDLLEEQLQEKMEQFCPQPTVDLHILLPSSYMNVSGNVIRNYCDLHHIYYKRKDRVLVLYDDLDLMFGDFKLKERSGDAGHNGIKDIEKRLGTNKFHRLKIGIHPPDRSSIITGRDFVLSKFNHHEMKKIDSIYNAIFETCLSTFPFLDEKDVMKRVNSAES